jgi:spore coat polysaccharide biosynthesis predicted glycosyltransferase SpsG
VAPGFLTSPPPALRRGRWIVSPRGLASQLSVSGIAIVAGGQTLYEACSLGVPTVSVAVVRAQRPAIEACASAGAVLDAGGPEMDDATAARVANGVARLFESRELRERVSARARLLIDGRGAQRVARRIASLVRTRRVARV